MAENTGMTENTGNSALLQALENYRKENGEAQLKLLAAELRRAQVLVGFIWEPAEEELEAYSSGSASALNSDGTAPELDLYEGNQEDVVIPVFTEMAEVDADYYGEGHICQYGNIDLLLQIMDSVEEEYGTPCGIVLNMFSDNLCIGRSLLEG